MQVRVTTANAGEYRIAQKGGNGQSQECLPSIHPAEALWKGLGCESHVHLAQGGALRGDAPKQPSIDRFTNWSALVPRKRFDF